jgi:hypothetical protein
MLQHEFIRFWLSIEISMQKKNNRSPSRLRFGRNIDNSMQRIGGILAKNKALNGCVRGIG